MKVYSLQTGPLQNNVYIIESGNKAIIVDCGMDYETVSNFLLKKGLTATTVLLTHSHFDHTLTASRFQQDGAKVYISTVDGEKVENGDILAEDFGLTAKAFTPDFLVNDNDIIEIENLTFKVILTPGHTDGSVCYLVENYLFSGDTLFFLSIGRTDFPTGDFSEMKKSLQRLTLLGRDLIVYPGHGEQTTLAFEVKNNPYMNL